MIIFGGYIYPLALRLVEEVKQLMRWKVVVLIGEVGVLGLDEGSSVTGTRELSDDDEFFWILDGLSPLGALKAVRERNVIRGAGYYGDEDETIVEDRVATLVKEPVVVIHGGKELRRNVCKGEVNICGDLRCSDCVVVKHCAEVERVPL
ncbi:hypothetical protein VNO78_08936 [Psophocarpus tetragonolobus]|uniref:Uncharacterized protein n=1 Tax=Psophocarpus tetragonolobus TaxID=3891 RepID=A0AAN9XTB8_PSOTE